MTLNKNDKNVELNLPDVIFLYGPPASGKGTQANKLQTYYSNYKYKHFDVGGLLRDFVWKNLGDISGEEFYRNLPSLEISIDKNIQRAIKIYKGMKAGNALNPDLVWHIITDKIENAIKNGEKLIVDGVGRTIEDCRRFGKIAKENNLKVAIFHICISEDEVIQRSVSRWYVPGNNNSFPGYISAKNSCKPNQEPWQREDDKDVTKIRHRFKNLYVNIYAKALSTLQLSCRADLFIIDGRDSIEEDFGHILVYLNSYYKKN